MPLLNSAAKLALKPVPTFISPRAHAIIDYVTVGSFLFSALSLWPRHKRAALGALICGGASLAVNLLTDYPGGVKKAISFRTHADIDLGLAGMTATMPEFLAFANDTEKKIFMAQGAVMTAVRQLTDFPQERRRPNRPFEHSKAA
jgi:hypothetical protein